jgi:hypothetical protein
MKHKRSRHDPEGSHLHHPEKPRKIARRKSRLSRYAMPSGLTADCLGRATGSNGSQIHVAIQTPWVLQSFAQVLDP